MSDEYIQRKLISRILKASEYIRKKGLDPKANYIFISDKKNSFTKDLSYIKK
jgi:hypothetical protein